MSTRLKIDWNAEFEFSVRSVYDLWRIFLEWEKFFGSSFLLYWKANMLNFTLNDIWNALNNVNMSKNRQTYRIFRKCGWIWFESAASRTFAKVRLESAAGLLLVLHLCLDKSEHFHTRVVCIANVLQHQPPTFSWNR